MFLTVFKKKEGCFFNTDEVLAIQITLNTVGAEQAIKLAKAIMEEK